MGTSRICIGLTQTLSKTLIQSGSFLGIQRGWRLLCTLWLILIRLVWILIWFHMCMLCVYYVKIIAGLCSFVKTTQLLLAPNTAALS